MEAFFESWLQRQEELLHDLLAVRSGGDAPCGDDDDRLRELVDRTLAHCEAYYMEKARLADRDALLVYSPTWLTPFERTFLWVAGFRPSFVFRLFRAAVAADGIPGATPEQAMALEALEADVGEEERKLTREMAGLQVALASPQVMVMVLRAAAARNGHTQADEDEVVGPLVRSLRLLLTCADGLRVRLVRRLAEMLRPAQMADLLVAAGQLHLRIRGWGMRPAGREPAGRAAA